MIASYEAFYGTTRRENVCTFAFKRDAYDIVSMMNMRNTEENWHIHTNTNGTLEARGKDAYGRTLYAAVR